GRGQIGTALVCQVRVLQPGRNIMIHLNINHQSSIPYHTHSGIPHRHTHTHTHYHYVYFRIFLLMAMTCCNALMCMCVYVLVFICFYVRVCVCVRCVCVCVCAVAVWPLRTAFFLIYGVQSFETPTFMGKCLTLHCLVLLRSHTHTHTHTHAHEHTYTKRLFFTCFTQTVDQLVKCYWASQG